MGPCSLMTGLDFERATKIVDRGLAIALSLARSSTLDVRVPRPAEEFEGTIGVRDRLVEVLGLDITSRAFSVCLMIAPLEIDQAVQILDCRAMIT